MIDVRYKVVKNKTFCSNLYEFFHNLVSPVDKHLTVISYRTAVKEWKYRNDQISSLTKIMNSGISFTPEIVTMLHEYINDSNSLREALDEYEKKLTSKK